jgi:hypothetical protein
VDLVVAVPERGHRIGEVAVQQARTVGQDRIDLANGLGQALLRGKAGQGSGARTSATAAACV